MSQFDDPLRSSTRFTFATEVVDHNDLMQELRWRHVNNTVNCPHQCRPALVMKHDYYTGGRQLLGIVPVFTPVTKHNITQG